MGAEINAYTSEYNTHYYLNVPKVNTDGAIELLCDMMFNPLFPEDEIEKERTVIQEERKMYEDNPNAFFSEESQKAFLNFQIGHRTIGNEKTINSLKRDDFVDFHQKFYGLDNTIMVIVSDNNPDDIFFLCDKHLKGNPFKNNVTIPIDSQLLVGSKRKHVFDRENIQQTSLMGLFPTTGVKSCDDVVHSCMLNIIGGGMSSMLFKEIRENLGLCYSVGAFDFVVSSDASVSGIYCQTDPKKASKAKKKILEIMMHVKKNGFAESNFNCSKAGQLGKFCREISSVSSLANIVGKSTLLGATNDFNKEYNEILNLSLNDVNSFAIEHLPNEKDIRWSQMNPKE